MSVGSYLVGNHLGGFLDMLGDDSGSGESHEEGDEEQAEEHDEDQQELALVHRVQPGVVKKKPLEIF